MIFVGIDPGKHGAVAWMDGTRKLVEVFDCPLVCGEYDYAAMDGLLASALTECRGDGLLVTMEEVHAMPSDGKCSAFSFGLGYGAWLALLGARRMDLQLVAPRVWKRTMLAGVANDKEAEAKALKQRFQGHPIVSQLHGPRGGLRDGRGDALFLAEYGRMTHKLSGRALTPVVVAIPQTHVVDGRYRGETPKE